MIRRKACAFTGHRPSKLSWRYNESDPCCMALKAVLEEQIKMQIEAGTTDFLSGMAQGIDQICAELVLHQREKTPMLRLHCILPCMGQDAEWTDAAQRRYRSIIKQADSRVYVNRAYCKECMLERDRYMIECASTLLAVYNGVNRSGTAATVNYARKLGREIIIINPASLVVTHENVPNNSLLATSNHA